MNEKKAPAPRGPSSEVGAKRLSLRRGLRRSFYRALASAAEKKFLRRDPSTTFGSFSGWQQDAEGHGKGIARGNGLAANKTPKLAWFHTSSAGELESLAPVVLAWISHGGRAVVSIFSPSAKGGLTKLVLEASALAQGTETLLAWAGYSPTEGEWSQALSVYLPDLFVTAKYEAWPELWMSLGELGIPLFIVGAKCRSSLVWAKRLCAVLGGKIPELHFLTASDGDSRELGRVFPNAKITRTGEPRWDRAAARAAKPFSRASDLLRLWEKIPGPRGLLAQLWPEDFKLWAGGEAAPEREALRNASLWIVPHQISEKNINGILSEARALGFDFTRSSRLRGGDPVRFLLVDEMGFLAELYQGADWAYVGGGFGKGIHSVIEPALHGIPILVGPAGAGKFHEVSELLAEGRLEIARTPDELGHWLQRFAKPDPERRQEFKKMNESKLGATARVLEALLIASLQEPS